MQGSTGDVPRLSKARLDVCLFYMGRRQSGAQKEKGENLRSPIKRYLSLVIGTFWVIILGAALSVPTFGQAAGNAPTLASSTVTLRWDKSPSRDVKGYRLHYGTASRSYSKTIDVGIVTTYTISNLIARKRYYFVVTAYNAAGEESPPSNECPFYVSSLTLKKRK
jgi:Fibronectin type III domain